MNGSLVSNVSLNPVVLLVDVMRQDVTTSVSTKLHSYVSETHKHAT